MTVVIIVIRLWAGWSFVQI